MSIFEASSEKEVSRDELTKAIHKERQTSVHAGYSGFGVTVAGGVDYSEKEEGADRSINKSKNERVNIRH